MRVSVLGFSFFFYLILHGKSDALSDGEEHASSPPRGWNSYDSFSWTISEEEFLQNAEIVSQKLLAHGYRYVVVDYLWYRRRVEGAYSDSLGFDVIDEWGRMMPDPERWPSSKGGKGFKEVAKKVHDMGLKFGIHVMRGISTQAVNANTPILDTTKGSTYEELSQQWRARDIGMKERACAWMPHGFMSVNTTVGAGRAFLRSLYQQYAEWGVDFVKHDCVFGEDFDKNEISIVSEVLRELDRPILYSLSPGTSATPALAKEISSLANMYRVTGDDWDSWKDVETHFDVARDFAASHLVGAQGLQGKSWPDLDMLPLGWLTDPAVNEGPHRKCNLSLHEQRTQVTLWSMTRSPIMFGGDMRHSDDDTLSLITNPTILEINTFSMNNMEFPFVSLRKNRSKRHHIPTKSYIKEANEPVEIKVAVTSCKDQTTKGWIVESDKRRPDCICWNDKSKRKNDSPICLYKRVPLLTSDEDIIYRQKYQGKHHLLASKTAELCLAASTSKTFTPQISRGSPLLPCKWHANQMWELNKDGTLVSSYSGLCAIVKEVKANANRGEVRSWVATGRRGEIYVAFFNLDPQKVRISANIKDLAKVLPSTMLRNDSCSISEVWTGKDYGITKQIPSTVLDGHGCALFVLKCN